MHGLIFETSIWLLAESTRFYFRNALSFSEENKRTKTEINNLKNCSFSSRIIFGFVYTILAMLEPHMPSLPPHGSSKQTMWANTRFYPLQIFLARNQLELLLGARANPSAEGARSNSMVESQTQPDRMNFFLRFDSGSNHYQYDSISMQRPKDVVSYTQLRAAPDQSHWIVVKKADDWHLFEQSSLVGQELRSNDSLKVFFLES